MSAIARYVHSKGHTVAGYDKTSTALTRKLESEGLIVHHEDNVDRLPEWAQNTNDPSLLIIYTPAVPKDTNLYQHFSGQGYSFIKRSEALAQITIGKKTIAVAGTHGKTTTSTYLAHILSGEGVNTTAFLGGISSNYQSNYVRNQTDGEEVIVLEADEYDRSFLRLAPDISVITSCEADHLDIYDNFDAVVATYNEFANKLKTGGTLVLHDSLKGIFQLREDINVAYYGFDHGHTIDGLRIEAHNYHFDIESLGLTDIVNGLPGDHNALNAAAALIAASQVSSLDVAKQSLASFKGIKRRFETHFESNTQTYIDDYAHHPSELKAAIETARALYPNRKLTVVFQPHLFSRTRDFQEGFKTELAKVDELLLMPIYPARELPIPGVTSEIIRPENTNCSILDHHQVTTHINENSPELLLTLGAGNIDLLIEPILEHFNLKNPVQ